MNLLCLPIGWLLFAIRCSSYLEKKHIEEPQYLIRQNIIGSVKEIYLCNVLFAISTRTDKSAIRKLTIIFLITNFGHNFRFATSDSRHSPHNFPNYGANYKHRKLNFFGILSSWPFAWKFLIDKVSPKIAEPCPASLCVNCDTKNKIMCSERSKARIV